LITNGAITRKEGEWGKTDAYLGRTSRAKRKKHREENIRDLTLLLRGNEKVLLVEE